MLAGRSAEAHMPPPAFVTVKVTEEAMTCRFLLVSELLEGWTGVDPKALRAMSDEERAKAKADTAAFFAENSAVTIDGVTVNGVLEFVEYEKFEDHGMDWHYGAVTVTYGLKGKPSQISLAWKAYGVAEDGWYIPPVEAELRAFKTTTYFSLSEEEPEFTWHAPQTTGVPRIFIRPRVEPPPTVTLPLFSVILLAAVLLGALVLRLTGRGRRVAWPLLALGLAGALATSGIAGSTWTLPTTPTVERPGEEEAAFIFQSLHRNIYRAFDYESEDDVYDTLARSVTGDLLEEVYGEVYESLIMREQGGVICRIQSSEILESTVEYPSEEDASWFRVQCKWRVTGQVGHMGHTHQRVNEYRARYTVAYEPEGWRIAQVDILEQTRTDDGQTRDVR